MRSNATQTESNTKKLKEEKIVTFCKIETGGHYVSDIKSSKTVLRETGYFKF